MTEGAENQLPEPKTSKPEEPIKPKPILMPSKLSVNNKGELVVEGLKEVFPTKAYNESGQPVMPSQEIGQNIDVKK